MPQARANERFAIVACTQFRRRLRAAFEGISASCVDPRGRQSNDFQREGFPIAFDSSANRLGVSAASSARGANRIKRGQADHIASRGRHPKPEFACPDTTRSGGSYQAARLCSFCPRLHRGKTTRRAAASRRIVQNDPLNHLT